MKRSFDILLVILASPIWVPVLLIIGIVVRLRLASPVLFTQIRAGLNGEPFKILKFRTMTDARDSHGNHLPDDERLTEFGRAMRATSLDELPELWNVLKGDMSLVGPRPLLVEYLPLYAPEQGRRHLVRPGITGWAQVNGRNAITWDEKFAQDVWYVDHRSLWLDVRILWRTLLFVVMRHGISAEGDATMPKFPGGQL